MGALPTLETPIVDVAHLVGISAPEHLGHQAIIVAAIVARIGVFKAVPVLGKDLFEDAPSRRSSYRHEAASLQSVGWSVIVLFYHTQPTISTPLAAHTRYPPSPTSPLYHRDVRPIAKWESLCYQELNRDREKPHSSPLPHHLAYGSVPRRFGVVTCCGEHLIGLTPSDQRVDC